MRKRILFILFIQLSINVLGQNKKELHSLIERMRLDSIELSNRNIENTNYLKNVIEKLKKDSTILYLQNLKESKEQNNKIIELNNKVNILNIDIDSSYKLIGTITKENKLIRHKVDSLIYEIKRIKDSIDQTNNFRYKYVETVPESLKNQYPFDFKYEYKMLGNGLNTPNIVPIGWSKDGKICYIQDFCNGGCGCCGTAIIVRDLNTNKIINEKYFGDEDFDMEIVGEISSTSLWSETKYSSSILEVINKNEIIPIGFGEYDTSKIIGYKNNNSFKVDIAINGNNYELISMKDNNKKSLYHGNLHDYDNYYGYKSNANYSGYFKSQINDYLALVIMHYKPGFEGETNYNIEIIGIKLE